MNTYERFRQPAHHILKIKNFSDLVKTGVEFYESKLFEAGGYQWRMVVYPNGTKGNGGNVSLSVKIDKDANAGKLTPGWHVDADVKVFVFNWKTGKYIVYEMTSGDQYSRYDDVTGAHTVDKFVNLNRFQNEYICKNGFCAFGAEILVMETKPDAETLTMVKNPSGGKYRWEIPNYSSFSTKFFSYSDEFTVGERKWKLKIYPTGTDGDAKGNALSMYLYLADPANLPPRGKVYAHYKLRIINQFGKANVEKTGMSWFSSSRSGSGYPEFLPLGDLLQKNKGFVMDNTLIVEVEIDQISISS